MNVSRVHNTVPEAMDNGSHVVFASSSHPKSCLNSFGDAGLAALLPALRQLPKLKRLSA